MIGFLEVRGPMQSLYSLNEPQVERLTLFVGAGQGSSKQVNLMVCHVNSTERRFE
jgi:hypothetical protein